jgi:signal transduction histidine kinase
VDSLTGAPADDQAPDVPAPDAGGGYEAQQLLIYAREINAMHQQQREQLQEVQRLYGDLQSKEQARLHLVNQLLSAQEGERRRIARDIHDGPLQDLGVLLLSIERGRRQIESGQIAEALATLSRLRADAQATVSTLRELVSDLRPAVLDTSGLLGALDFLAGRVGRETQMTIDVNSRLGSRLHPQIETVVFRLVQEGLNNIRKHAQAQNAWIWLERVGDELHLEVRDDGQGFTVEEAMPRALATGHLGLAGMYERAEAAGGRLTVETAPGQGTVLHFHLAFRGVDDPDPAAPPAPAP